VIRHGAKAGTPRTLVDPKARLGRGESQNPLLAKGAHVHRVDREALCRVISAALLSRDNACRCLQDACKPQRTLFDECDRPGGLSCRRARPVAESGSAVAGRTPRGAAGGREAGVPGQPIRDLCGQILSLLLA